MTTPLDRHTDTKQIAARRAHVSRGLGRTHDTPRGDRGRVTKLLGQSCHMRGRLANDHHVYGTSPDVHRRYITTLQRLHGAAVRAEQRGTIVPVRRLENHTLPTAE